MDRPAGRPAARSKGSTLTDTALSPDEARALLRECVTVVAPGETLVIRAADTWTPRQVHDVQGRLREVIADRGLTFEVLLVPGEEFAVVRRDDAAA